MKFVARCFGNQPKVIIEGHDIEHILSSNYFQLYTYSKKCRVVVTDNTVQLQYDGNDPIGVIGWIED